MIDIILGDVLVVFARFLATAVVTLRCNRLSDMALTAGYARPIGRAKRTPCVSRARRKQRSGSGPTQVKGMKGLRSFRSARSEQVAIDYRPQSFAKLTGFTHLGKWRASFSSAVRLKNGVIDHIVTSRYNQVFTTSRQSTKSIRQADAPRRLRAGSRVPEGPGPPHRLRMVQMLLGGRYPVGELAEACEIPSHMASEHLRLMQRCGFLKSETQGRKVYYGTPKCTSPT